MTILTVPDEDDYCEKLQDLLVTSHHNEAISILLNVLLENGACGCVLAGLHVIDKKNAQVSLCLVKDLSGVISQQTSYQIVESAFDKSPRWLTSWLFMRKNPTSLSRISKYIPFSSKLVLHLLSPPEALPLKDLIFIPYCYQNSRYIMALGLYKEASESVFNQLTTLALAYLVKWDKEHFEPSSHLSKSISLSETEIECLKWMAAGKTLQEISVITGMSYGNVRYHLNKARERSGYATMQQLLVHATHEHKFHPMGTDSLPLH